MRNLNGRKLKGLVIRRKFLQLKGNFDYTTLVAHKKNCLLKYFRKKLKKAVQ